MRFSKVVFAVGLTAAALFGAAVKDGALKVTGVVGDVRHYTITGDMSLQGTEAKLSGKMTAKILKVEDNGNVTLQESQNDLQVELNGQQVPVPDSVTVTVLHPDGTVAEVRGENSGPDAYRMATIETIKLPDFALENDKTWTADFPADSKTGVVHAKGDYKVLGSETLHGVDSWKIQMKVAEVDGDAPASTEGTVWMSKKDASLVKMTGKGTNLPVPGAPGPVSGTETIEMVDEPAGK